MKTWKVVDTVCNNSDLEWQLNQLEKEGMIVKEVIYTGGLSYKIICTVEDDIEE